MVSKATGDAFFPLSAYLPVCFDDKMIQHLWFNLKPLMFQHNNLLTIFIWNNVV